MKNKIKWGGIYNKKRFDWLEKERREQLRKLTINQSIKIVEDLTSKAALSQFLPQLKQHIPVCLKLSLTQHKKWLH